MKIRILAAAIVSTLAIGTAQAANIGSANANHDFSAAQLIPSGYFTTIFNSAIKLSDTLPNASVVARTDGPYDYYRFTTSAKGTIILDIDNVFAQPGNPGSFNSFIALWKADDVTLLFSNNDGIETDPGSYSGFDAYLELRNMSAGSYVVGVSQSSSTAGVGGFATGSTEIPRNSFYTLNISAPVPEPETYAMFLAGLGLMAGIARRRRINI